MSCRFPPPPSDHGTPKPFPKIRALLASCGNSDAMHSWFWGRDLCWGIHQVDKSGNCAFPPIRRLLHRAHQNEGGRGYERQLALRRRITCRGQSRREENKATRKGAAGAGRARKGRRLVGLRFTKKIVLLCWKSVHTRDQRKKDDSVSSGCIFRVDVEWDGGSSVRRFTVVERSQKQEMRKRWRGCFWRHAVCMYAGIAATVVWLGCLHKS